jgi:hypothetical protein
MIRLPNENIDMQIHFMVKLNNFIFSVTFLWQMQILGSCMILGITYTFLFVYKDKVITRFSP